MALLSTRTNRTATQDENGDGRVVRNDDRAATTTITPAASATATVAPPTGRAQVDERQAAQRRLEAERRAQTVATTPATATPRETAEMPAAVGARARASFLATLSLILGLGGAFTVLTGVLAGPGVGVGLLATVAAIGGISATSRPNVAGKGNAMLGMALGLAAVVVGVLAITGNLPWLNATTDQVTRLHDWLDVRVPWLFPNS
jgi:hypothetical protein